MKKNLIVSALLSNLIAFSVNATQLPIHSLTITGGAFEMGFPPAPGNPIVPAGVSPFVMGEYQMNSLVDVANLTNTAAAALPGDITTYVNYPYSLGAFQFFVFGAVAVFTGPTDAVNGDLDYNGVHDGAETSPPFAAASGTVDDAAADSISLDLSSFIAYFSGAQFQQGNGPTSPVYTGLESAAAAQAPVTGTYNPATGAFDVSWNKYIVGGSFDGQNGFWNLTGTVNTAPLFTSTAPTTVAENTSGTIYTAVTTDTAGDTISYSLSGDDSTLFSIDASGNLSFVTPPDFENPDDTGGDHVYNVTIIATDDSALTLATNQDLTITVTDVNEGAPVFTSGSSFSVPENQTGTLYTAAATDVDTLQTVTYSFVAGGDEALFNLDSNTGVMTFKNAPDFENGSGSGTTVNDYVVTVRATDDHSSPLTADQVVTISVTDVVIETLVFTSAGTANFAENGSTTVYTAAASGPNLPISFSLNGGVDVGLFTITSGMLTFNSPPDFENPQDAAGVSTAANDNIYEVTIQANDGATTLDLNLLVTVTDVNDNAPVFTSNASSAVSENQTSTGYTATTTDIDTVGGPVTYSINGGADALLFNIAAGVLTFKTAPDFENPGDAGADNVYNVNIDAFDGVNTTQQAVDITVMNAPATPPVITLLGNSSVTINEGDNYVDQGATASDDIDGNITAQIVTGNPVPSPATPGTYTVTYDVTDSEGTPATQVTRTVTVTNAPGIYISGASVININEGDTYTDNGATATDVEDGVITGSIVTTGTVNTSVAGTYNITYTVTDSDGIQVSATRKVKVNSAAGTVLGVSSLTIESGDFVMGPSGVITAGDITPFNMGVYQGSAPAAVGTEASYKPTSLATFEFGTGAQAFGPVAVYTASTDGVNSGFATPSATVDTVNSTITITMPSWVAFWNGSSFAMGPTTTDGNKTSIDGVGTYNPATNAYDISWQSEVNGGAFNGQIANWHIAGTVTPLASDSEPPAISVAGSDQVLLQVGSPYTELGVAAVTDNVDGVMNPASVTVAGGVDVNTVGTYTITYSISDSSSNIGVATRTVLVVNGNQPSISLNGSAVVNVPWNGTYIDDGAAAQDVEDGDLTANITTVGATVDTSVLGTSFVTYNVSDSDGNPAFEVVRVVNVVDQGTPTITLTGASNIYLKQGDSYVEEGATATDDIDTNPGITNRIVITGVVDTTTEGTYTVSYDVTDSAGNDAPTVTRTVYVDFSGPEITIVGMASLAVNVGDTFVDEGATATDTVSGSLTVTPDCTTVDTSVAGTYSCTYTATDDAGNVTVVSRLVTVIDTALVIENVPLKLIAMQSGKATGIAITSDGNVVVSTNLPVGGSDTFDWSATDNNLAPVAGTGTDTATFTFDPSGLAEGSYQLSVTTNAGTSDQVTSTRLIMIALMAPALSSVDTDGDGINDDVEGAGDSDNDGIPDYLDNSNDPANTIRVPGHSSPVVSSAGTLRLGTTAFASSSVTTGGFTPYINIDDIIAHGGPAGGLAPANTDVAAGRSACVGGCFDVEVADIDPGSAVSLVLPLNAPIEENMVYSKYTYQAGWVDFSVTDTDKIFSSGLVNGVCPAVSAVGKWIEGLFPGDVCILIVITDGGANDADGVANGVVVDPSGAQTVPPAAEPNRDFTGNGCSVSNTPVAPIHRGDWVFVACFIAWLGLLGNRRRKLTRNN